MEVRCILDRSRLRSEELVSKRVKSGSKPAWQKRNDESVRRRRLARLQP